MKATFFLNLIQNLPGCRRYLSNKTIISSLTILEKLPHETFRVTSQLLSLLQYQRPWWGKDEFLPATTAARLNLVFIAIIAMTP